MTSIAGLEARLRRVIDQIEPESRTWCFALSPHEPIPAEVAAQFGPRDTIIVQELPCNYFSGLEEQAEEGTL